MPGRTARAALLLALALALPVRAQDAPPAAGDVVTFQFRGVLELQEHGDELVWIATPSVTITRGALRIYADHMVIWSKKGAGAPGDARFSLQEFYAEGNLRMESGTQVLQGERAYVNLVDGTVLLVKGTLRTRSKKRGFPLTLSAGEFRRIGAGDMTAKNVTVSTCEFTVPDYRLNVREVVIHEDWKSGDLDFYGVGLQIDPLDFPILWVPWLPVQFGSQVPLRRLAYQRSRRFGESVFSKWGYDISKTRRDAKGDPIRDEEGDPEVDEWGSVLLDVNWLQLRGVGIGPEYEYQWDDYRGFGDVYYIHDSGRSPDSDFNDRLVPIPTTNRGRGRFFHRQQLIAGLSGDLELHWLSDRNVREEFFEKEFKTEKEPESYGLVRWMEDNWGMTGLYRPRLNRFQSQVEYIPQVTQWLIDQPLPFGFHLSHHAQYANLRFRRDEDLPPELEQPRLNRADVQETLSYPLALGPARILPFGTVRYSYFDYGPGTDLRINRFAASLGGRARLAAWKLYPWTSAVLGLEGVRHTLSGEVRALEHWTSWPSRRLYQFDAVDAVDRYAEVAIEVRNRFETKKPGSDETYDALNVGIATEFYPDADRDTARALRENVIYPSSWITLAPDRDGEYRPRNASNVHVDLAATLRDKLDLVSTLDWNPYRRRIEETHIEVRIRPAENLKLILSQQYVTGLTDTIGVGFEWGISEKWTIGGRTEYDLRGRRSLDHSYTIRRNMHDFDLELGVRYDGGRSELNASLSLIPHGKKENRLRGP